MNKMDLVVFICRAQLPTLAHLETLIEAKRRGHRVAVLLGSANHSRDIRQPFYWEERADMILAGLQDMTDDVSMFHFRGVDDFFNDALWLQSVQAHVNDICAYLRVNEDFQVDPARIALIGYGKDATGYYLKKFHQWKSIRFQPVYIAPPLKGWSDKSEELLSSTFLRNVLFDPNGLSGFNDILPYTTKGVIQIAANRLGKYDDLFEDTIWNHMRAERRYEINYKKELAGEKWPRTHVTSDIIVHHAGYVLLVRRKDFPGRGLWAFPGGFIKEYERIRAAAEREGTEETRIKVPPKVLNGSFVGHHLFDDPHRSIRGRVITHGHFYDLDPAMEQPPVKGRSDAREARWCAIGDIDPRMLLEDHALILQKGMSLFNRA